MDVTAFQLPTPPPDTRYVEHQAGGHCRCNGDDVLPNLQHKDGWFLKLLRESPRYWHEVEFYVRVFDPNCQDEDIVTLRRLIPKFDGIFQTVFDGKDTKYITLEDLTYKFEFPCILDVKMKADVHDPNSGNIHTVTDLSIKMGFLLDGLQVYDTKARLYRSYQKMFGRNLNEESLKNVLYQFVNGCHGGRSEKVLKSIVQRLDSIRQWAVSQRKFKFYRSSLLFVYDAAYLLNNSQTKPFESADDFTNVRLVDFAKFEETTETDFLYVRALDNLIQCFLTLL